MNSSRVISVIAILVLLVAPQLVLAQANCNNGTNANGTNSAANLYNPPASCTNSAIQECVAFYDFCQQIHKDDCTARVTTCPSLYVDCINQAASQGPLNNCPHWGSSIRLALINYFSGAAYDGSELEASCQNVVCQAYATAGPVCASQKKNNTAGVVCVPPTAGSDTPKPSLLPTSTPVPAGTVYHFTATFEQGVDPSVALRVLANRLGVDAADIEILSTDKDGAVEFEFKGPNAELAAQQMVGMLDNKQEMKQFGITTLSAAAVDGDNTDAPATPAPGGDDNDKHTIKIAAIAVGCVLVVAGLAIFVVMRSRRTVDHSVQEEGGYDVEDPLVGHHEDTPMKKMRH